MNRFVQNRKCFVLCFLSITLAVVTSVAGPTFGGTKTEAPAGRLGRPLSPSDIAYINRKAEETYEKRNAEITPWVENSVPPNPGNAALLYYQAFLLRPDLDIITSQKIDYVLTGDRPDRETRTYLRHCLPMIQLAEIATQIPQCKWGVWNGSEPSRRFEEGKLRSEVWDLSRILLVDARVLAADGNYRMALERCLTVRRFARHLCKDSRLDLLARNPDVMALRTIQHVLCVMPPDLDTLMWFRGRFAVVHGLRLSFAEMLQAKSRSFLELMQTNPGTLASLKSLTIERSEDEQAKENIRNLTDRQILSLASELLPPFVDSIQRILDNEMTYKEKLTRMQRLYDTILKEYDTDPVSKYVIIRSGMRGMIDHQYPFLVGHKAHINGIKAAVEVYLVLAKEGKIPEKLPDDLPKDPYTNQNFIYEITDDGFVLSCQSNEFERGKERFIFNVKKKSN